MSALNNLSNLSPLPPSCRPMGLKNLVAALGGPELSKPKNVTMSDWARRQLSDKQVWTMQCVDVGCGVRMGQEDALRQTGVLMQGVDGPGVDGQVMDGQGMDGPGVDGPGVDGPGGSCRAIR